MAALRLRSLVVVVVACSILCTAAVAAVEEPRHQEPYVASHRGRPLHLCEGDCDHDSDCAGDLLCFQRGPGGADVPGCRGGTDDLSRIDYCVQLRHPHPTHHPVYPRPTPHPTSYPTPHPTPRPTPHPSRHPTPPPTRHPTPHPTPTRPSPHPTPHPTTPHPTPHPDSALCIANPSCVALGLTGFCCPSDQGETLDCCQPTVACSANARCVQAGLLSGNCCPSNDGVLLHCCGDDEGA